MHGVIRGVRLHEPRKSEENILRIKSANQAVILEQKLTIESLAQVFWAAAFSATSYNSVVS